MTTFDCRSCGGHWNEGPTRNHRYDCLCRKCLGSLAREAGEALNRLREDHCCEPENKKMQYDSYRADQIADEILAKLRAAGLLSADDHT